MDLRARGFGRDVMVFALSKRGAKIGDSELSAFGVTTENERQILIEAVETELEKHPCTHREERP